MPVHKVGPNAYKYGKHGHTYVGKNAKAHAEKQGRAIRAAGYKGK